MPTRQILTFDSGDFLVDAIREFLESGANPHRIASSVIKVATGIELLLKSSLELICPALILDKIDPHGLQVAKLFNLGNKLRTPKELDGIELKTASFETLLQRASKFLDLSQAEPYLRELHKIRNRLVHHRGEVDLLETNLLLVRHIFPFLQELAKTDLRVQLRLDPNLWKKIKQIERDSTDAFSSQLAKKLAYYAEAAKKLKVKQIKSRIDSEAEQMDSDEVITNEALKCPACGNHSLTSFGDYEVDFDDRTGQPTASYYFVVMRCRVCGLDIDPAEIEHIMNDFDRFLGTDEIPSKPEWESALEHPENDF